jgi:hypothetical protein
VVAVPDLPTFVPSRPGHSHEHHGRGRGSGDNGNAENGRGPDSVVEVGGRVGTTVTVVVTAVNRAVPNVVAQHQAPPGRHSNQCSQRREHVRKLQHRPQSPGQHDRRDHAGDHRSNQHSDDRATVRETQRRVHAARRDDRQQVRHEARQAQTRRDETRRDVRHEARPTDRSGGRDRARDGRASAAAGIGAYDGARDRDRGHRH